MIRRVTADERDQHAAPEVAGIGRRGRDAIIQLTIRTGVLRVLSLIGTVLLARILQPADFGVFAVIIFAVGVLAPVGDLGLGAALIQQRHRPSAADIRTVFTAQQATWLILLTLAWLLADLIRLAGPDLPADSAWMIRATAVAIYASQLRSVPVAMMTRVLRFGPLAVIEVTQQIAYVVVAVGIALAGGGVWSFVIGLLVQYLLGTALTYVAWGHFPGLGLDRASLSRLLGFGVSFQAANLLGLLREAVVPVFGGLAGGVVGIGFLNFGQRVGRLLGSIDEVIGRVAFPAFSRLQGDTRRTGLALVHVVETAAVVVSLLFGWAIAVAPTLITVVFSETWRPAVPVFQLTALSVMAGVPASLLRGLGFSAGLARPMLRWSFIALLATFAVFPVLVLWLGLVGGGIGFVVYGVVLLLGFAHATRSLSPFPWLRLARIYLIGAAGGVTAALSLELVGGVPGLILSGLVYAVAFGSLMLVFEREQLWRSWRLLRGTTTLEAG
jgi:O-antigen/teichoic acid export membrane protein